MDLYFLPMACSIATRIALYETNTDATFIEVDPFTKTLLASGDDYLQINPLGLVPVLRTDDGELIRENLSVLRYLGRKTGLSTDDNETAELTWLSFIATELHTGLFAPQFERPSDPAAKAQARRRGKARLSYLDKQLEGRDYLLDSFSVADAYLIAVLNFSRGCDLDLSPWPNVLRYFKQGMKRPSVARAMEVELPLYIAEQARRPSAGAAPTASA